MRLVFWTAFWTFMLDQIVKYVVVHMMNLRHLGEIDVLPPFLNLRMAWNRGVNFGLFSDPLGAHQHWVLIGIALVVVLGVIVWLRRDMPGRWGQIGAGLLIGGALGNVVDRVLYTAVADFLNMSCCGINNPYAFNIADVTIFFGALLLVLTPQDKKPA